MKKFSIKKLAAVILSAATVGTMSAGAAGCFAKSMDMTEPENIEITRLPVPDDGSLPTAHTCAENMAYVVSVFDSQTKYHSYSYGVTSASIATQTTRTFRDYNDGVLLTTDLTYSSMVKSGSQTCTVFNEKGEGEVYFRVSEDPQADTLPAQAVWDEGAPTFFSERAYHYTYGLLPTELFNYIVNEQNIIDSEEVKANPDGTYTQNFTLDPAASTYFYRYGMKTRGGLSGYPEFQSITFSVTFDGNWRILSSDMHEVAMVNKGVVVSSVSDFSTEYWYGDDHFDDAHYAYYDSYYKNYIGDDDLEQGGSVDDKLVVDVTNVLSNGFSQIMNGGSQFEISADLGKNSYKGYAFVSLDLANPLETLDLKVSLGKSLEKQTFYVEYGDGDMAAYYGKDFALQANLAEVKLAAGKFGEIIDKISSVFAKQEESAPETTLAETASEEGEDPLTALMNSMVLVAGEKQAVLTLDTDDLLGLGVGLSVRLVFGINNNEISFRGGSVKNISIGGEKLDFSLIISTTNAPIISRDKCDAPADLADYVSDVYALLGSDLLEVHAGVHGSDEAVKISALKGIDADVTAYVDLAGITVGAEVRASYKLGENAISAAAKIWYDYKGAGYGNATVALTELNGAPADIVLTCDVKDLVNAISSLLTTAGAGKSAATDGLVSVINGALSSDFSGLLTETYADKASIKVGVSVDTVLKMLGVKTSVKFGSCTLKYHRGGGVYGGVLSAELPALGFNLSVNGTEGEIEKPDLTDALDLVYAINDIKELANSGLYALELTLDGGADGVTIPQLGGINAKVEANLTLEGIAASVNAAISYTHGEDVVSAKLAAWYEKGKGAGKIALRLYEVNSRPLSAKVYCDIDEITTAVETLLGYAGIKTQPFDGGIDISETLSGALNNVLGADFSELLPVLKTDNGGITIALNMDEALSLFGVNAGVELGNLSLGYRRSTETAGAAVIGSAPALGLAVKFCGGKGAVEFPDVRGYFNLTDLVNTVNSAWSEVNGIIEEKAVAFEIEKGKTYLSLDGIDVDIWGEGEVSWKKGHEYVALDLEASISEEGTSDVIKLKLIYDKNAVDMPLVRLALNEVGLEIYKDDIDTVVNGFNDIYGKISALLGTEAQTDETGEQTESSVTTVTDNDKLMNLIFRVLSSGKWVDVLGDMTLTSDGKSVALSYLADNAVNIKLGADGGLSLEYDGKLGSRFSLGGSVKVTSGAGALTDVIESKLTTCNMASSKTGSASFVKLAYDFLFDAIWGVSVENILGSQTYAVTFGLNGANTTVEALKDVYIDAQIYVTGEREENKGKIAEANLNVDAAGVVLKLNVITERRGNNTHFYINLSQVMDIVLPDLKFHATQESLYETFKVIISTVNDTNILDSLGKLLGGSDNAEEEKTGQVSGGEDKTQPVIEESAINKICDIVTRLLDFNFSEAVPASKEEDGIFTATLDLDNVLSQLGLEKIGSLGTVAVEINHNSHSMTTSGVTPVTDENGELKYKEWIYLSSELTDRRDYSDGRFNRRDYVSIEFLPDLISDLVKTVTDEQGDLRNSFTLSGGINANLVGILDVNIDPCTVTVNIGDDGLWLSAVMHVNKAKVIGIGIPESTVGITYKNGLLTLAKGLNTATPEYKVVTFDYFMDNLLSGDGLLNWLLEISGWGLFKSYLPEIKSGLTTTQDVMLYESSAAKEEQEISMYSFVNALRVVIGGLPTAEFGDYGALENDMGVYDNYYGFALNAGAVTGGVLTKLNAAITRTDGGLDRVLASGAIQSYVSFSANLQFKNNYNDEYQLGNALQGEVTAPDLYEKALAKAAECNYIPDFDYFEKNPSKGYDKKFGCMSVAVSGGNYTVSTQYSNVLYSHTLTIVSENGETEERLVRHGSTVYLYDNAHPVYADETKTVRVLYSTVDGEVGAASVIMNSDVTVYEVRRAAVIVVVHNGSEEVIVNSFAGDKVPTSVAGLETISKPVYADGKEVGDNEIIDGSANTIHIYGAFVKTETVVNYVKYTFSAKTMSYTASGKAAGFNDTYSKKGNTLVIESEINGFTVTAIAAGAFANDTTIESNPIKSVIVPATVTNVGANAFKDNFGMESATFLADSVYFEGNTSDKTFAFYGCSVDGGDGEERTNLKIYYNEATCDAGGTYWTHFRTKTAVGTYYKYVGNDPDNKGSGITNYHANGGGALYGKGSWTFVNYSVKVDVNGLLGSTLTENAVTGILSKYYPVITTEAFTGSAQAGALNKALETDLTQFDRVKDGITYKCVFTVEYVEKNGELVAEYSFTYSKAATISVRSNVQFVYYGVTVKANELTKITVAIDGDSINPVTPELAGYKLVSWSSAEENGETVYSAQWAKELRLYIKLNRGGYDTSKVYVNDWSTTINGHALPGKKDANVTDVLIYEGEATFTLNNSVLTIRSYDVTYTVYVEKTGISGSGKRNITSSLTGSVDIAEDATLTLYY